MVIVITEQQFELVLIETYTVYNDYHKMRLGRSLFTYILLTSLTLELINSHHNCIKIFSSSQ